MSAFLTAEDVAARYRCPPREEHMICIGFDDTRREGRYLVTTFRCSICHRETRTLVRSPTIWQRFMDWLA